MAEDVRHINMTDPSTESVYCHLQHQVAKFDGTHVDEYCWGCPFWGGLAGGYGVVCVYDDPGATGQEVKYTKPAAAMAEAPEAVEAPDTVASQAGITARDARIELSPPEQEQADISAQEAPAAEGEQAAAPQAQPAKAPAGGAPAAVAPAAAPKKPFPPKAGAVPPKQAVPAVAPVVTGAVPPKKKFPFQKATVADVIGAVLKIGGGQATDPKVKAGTSEGAKKGWISRLRKGDRVTYKEGQQRGGRFRVRTGSYLGYSKKAGGHLIKHKTGELAVVSTSQLQDAGVGL